MRIIPGCFSVLVLMVAACICVSIVSGVRANHNRAFFQESGRALQSPPPQYYDHEYAPSFSRGIAGLIGGTFAFGLLFCIGGPVELILLGVAVFFYVQYRHERQLRETLAAQYAQSQVPWDEPPQSI